MLHTIFIKCKVDLMYFIYFYFALHTKISSEKVRKQLIRTYFLSPKAVNYKTSTC